MAHIQGSAQSRSPFFQAILPIERLRVLVVEDDRDLWPILELAMRDSDCETTFDFTTDADSALALMRRRRYRAVLADYLIEGDRTGFWLRRFCQSLQPHANFGMMSCLPLRAHRSESFPFLYKPFTTERVRGFIEQLVDSA